MRIYKVFHMRFTLTFFVFCLGLSVRATHTMGGELSYRCAPGGGTVFQLTLLRDCNEVDINPISESISVWGVPGLTSITVIFQNRFDLSPTCTPVLGGPPALDCGVGSFGGNGLGAIERVVYESAPVVLIGVPPANGWHFTFSNFSRSGSITNIASPATTGMTIVASMYINPSSIPGTCNDNSSVFAQDPYMIICAGERFSYNPHAIDPDGDSVAVELIRPLDRLISGVYTPNVNPSFLNYQVGFSELNPTPDPTFNPGNLAFALNNVTGHSTFTSVTSGAFVVKFIAKSFRNGILIGSSERDMQVFVTPCGGSNTMPSVNGPFPGGLYETTVNAGDLVSFTIQSTDVENLQNGAPQTNTLTTSGWLYGTNFTSNSGCQITDCATLNASPAINGIQGVSANFSWQTDCAHLIDGLGNPVSEKIFTYVFKFTDNYCQIPKQTFRTIKVTVKNPGVLPSEDITCISTALNGDVTVQWTTSTNSNGAFQNYTLSSIENGVEVVEPSIVNTSTTIASPGTELNFFLGVKAGCDFLAFSDTVRNVYLTVFNPMTGIAQLSWNTPALVPPAGMLPTCTVLREYPLGTWTTIATLPYATTNFKDTIRICQAFLNYRIVYETPTCQWTSNVAGGLFEDMITPQIPVIEAISVDTLTGNFNLSWSANSEPDTYGYVIYHQDANGFLIEIDTAWGINNLTLLINTIPVDQAQTFSVAAFDSCYTSTVPATFQTSAKSILNTSIYAAIQVNPCNGNGNVTWTPYLGWGANLTGYEVYYRPIGSVWQLSGFTTNTNFNLTLESGLTYEVFVKAIHINGFYSFSNKVISAATGPSGPAVHYLRVASVDGNTIILRHEISIGSNVKSIRFEKLNLITNVFEELITIPASTQTISTTDENVEVNRFSYTYRAVLIDSCGLQGAISNKAKTILLSVETDQMKEVNTLSWTAYNEYFDPVLNYDIYRGFDGVFDPTPIYTASKDERYYIDDVSIFPLTWSGKTCYLIVANESFNPFGFAERSFSNQVCAVIQPIVYIPNSFSPNGDGLNDIFIPVGGHFDVGSYEFSILDRWGGLIFQSKDPLQGWDGAHRLDNKQTPEHVYAYVLRVKDGNNQEYTFRGSVTMLPD
jgi:gliding motility-associated-like protein